MEIPSSLARALETLLEKSSSAPLAQAVKQLTARYQVGDASSVAGELTADEALAYAATRMPATYGAVAKALVHTASLWPAFRPSTLLDAGSGPGTALWAAQSTFPSLESMTALEREPAMRALAHTLLETSGTDWNRQIQWLAGDLTRAHLAQYDLVVASYVLTELPESQWEDAANRLWNHTRGALVLVEPGTPAGFQRIRKIRQSLITRGAHVIAPCPHDGPCPLAEKDWCHFAERVARSRRHRQLKGGVAPFEDEKYAFVALSREPARFHLSRVLRHPHDDPGRIQLELCTQDGLSREIVTKKTRERFRAARKVAWGDTWPDITKEGTTEAPKT